MRYSNGPLAWITVSNVTTSRCNTLGDCDALTDSADWRAFEKRCGEVATGFRGRCQRGVGRWPGGMEPTALIEINAGNPWQWRAVASSLAGEFKQEAVRLVIGPRVVGVRRHDWELRYPAPREELENALRDVGCAWFDGRVRLNTGSGFLSDSHPDLVARFGRPSVLSVRVERWGPGQEQLGFGNEHMAASPVTSAEAVLLSHLVGD